MLCDILDSVSRFFLNISNSLGSDALFFIALAIEAFLVIFFLVKSMFSYEAKLNRSLEKMNVWLFNNKTITEENIREVNMLFKTKMPKRVCYFWQQYILFREGNPSSYLSSENLIEKPLKTSSYNSNIKNLSIFTWIWALVSAVFILISASFSAYPTGQSYAMAILVAIFVVLIGVIFIVYLRARKNSILNSLYQNAQLFGRFMDNACVDLPSYIDYQILFTPQEIEHGQPVLREFLDYKARTEKEEFNKARIEGTKTEEYDFSASGVDGSLVLDRAMRESEIFLKTKEKILLQIAQFEAQLETRRKNFDTVQKEYQTKIQASKENVDRLRQMQEETTNRIESNYYRKQQTQEIGKQEQYEQEFEQQRTKYLLEKKEGEDEIAKLNEQLEEAKNNSVRAMTSEYQSFFNKFCQSAEKVVTKAFSEKLTTLKDDKEKDQEYITQLEIRLKNKPEQGSTDPEDVGQYDEQGNYVYPNGTFYDPEGNFHDEQGNIWSQNGEMISKAEPKAEEKQVVDFDEYDPLEFMSDVAQTGDVYGVAEKVIENVDENMEVKNSTEGTIQQDEPAEAEEKPVEEAEKDETKPEPAEEKEPDVVEFDDFDWDVLMAPEEDTEKKEEEPKAKAEAKEEKPAKKSEEKQEPAEEKTETPKKKAGRPRKIVAQEEEKPKRKVGRPKKEVPSQPETTEAKKRGRPKKVTAEPVKEEPKEEKKKVGRPRKIVQQEAEPQAKRGRGRPKKSDTISEINQRLLEEEKRLNELREALNNDLENAVNGINSENDKTARREELIQEISRLQDEAQRVISQHNSEKKISEINSKLEQLLDEVKKLY